MAELKFDAVIVGAGLAGVTAAYLLGREGLEVALVERGEYPGAKNVFGGVVYGHVLSQLFPQFWNEAPIERYVTRRIITFMSEDSSLAVQLDSARFSQPPYYGFTVLRSKFDRWYASQAQKVGVLLIPETTVEGLVYQGGQIAGVTTSRNGKLLADVVIAADGAPSRLARSVGLGPPPSAKSFALGVKEIISLPRATLEERFGLSDREGLANEFVGGLPGAIRGGGFIYTNSESLSVGVVLPLDSLKSQRIPPFQILEAFKGHPRVRHHLRGGEVKEYCAHLIPEGRMQLMPKLYRDGMLVVGDAAGLVLNIGIVLAGTNYAFASGIAAAKTVLAAKRKGDYSERSLAVYESYLKQLAVVQDFATFRKASQVMANPRLYSVYPQLVCQVAEDAFMVNNRPRQKILRLIMRRARGRIPRRQLFRDAFRIGRLLLW